MLRTKEKRNLIFLSIQLHSMNILLSLKAGGSTSTLPRAPRDHKVYAHIIAPLESPIIEFKFAFKILEKLQFRIRLLCHHHLFRIRLQ